jgi:hypothetical protein
MNPITVLRDLLWPRKVCADCPFPSTPHHVCKMEASECPACPGCKLRLCSTCVAEPDRHLLDCDIADGLNRLRRASYVRK